MKEKLKKALVLLLTLTLSVNMPVSGVMAAELEPGASQEREKPGENLPGEMMPVTEPVQEAAESGVSRQEPDKTISSAEESAETPGTVQAKPDTVSQIPESEGENGELKSETVKMEITGFGEMESNQIRMESKVPAEDIGFPENLKVFLDDFQEPVNIPVTWVCGDDYENTEYETYTFSPRWDEERYFFVGSSSDVPCLEVSIEELRNQNVRAGDEVTPQAADYMFSNGVISGLSDTFLNSLTETQKQNIHLVIPGTINGQAVTAIGKDAFKLWYNNKYTGCQFVSLDLTQAIELTSIGEGAFYPDSGLKGTLTIPSKVTSIGKDAFRGCSGFTGTLSLPQELKTIGNYAFFDIGCSGTLQIPEKVTSIGENAFKISDSKLPGFSGELVIPASVNTLGKVAFSGNKNITSVVFAGNNLTEIPDSVFRYCSLTSAVTIPSSVQKIGATAFGNTNMKTCYLPKRTDPGNSAYLVSNTFGSLTSGVPIIVCDKADFQYICSTLGTDKAKKVGYDLSVSFENGGNIPPINRLYNLPYNYVKDDQGVWSADSTYRFPEVQGKNWRLSPTGITPVSEASIVKQDKLYAVTALEDPVITFGDGIDKVYDGRPETLKVTATHPLAKPYAESGEGDVVFFYTWTWDTISSSNPALSGFDKNQYKVTDVRAPFEISCTVTVQACIRNINATGKLVNTQFYKESYSFPVNILKIQPEVNPVYPKGMLNIADGMPEISLSTGDSPGVVSWDAGQTLKEGEQEYRWTYKPEKNAAAYYNYEEKTGTAKLYGVDGKVFKTTVHKTEHGQIDPGDGFEVVQGNQVVFQFKPDAGYRLEQASVNGQDVTDAVVNGSYILENVQSDPQVSAVFSLLSADDMGEIIEQLPEIPEEDIPTVEEMNMILDAKQHFDALPDSEQAAVPEAKKKQLREAVASLPQVETVVKGELQVPDETLLLDNMTSQDAKKLQENDSSFKIEVVAEDTQPGEKEAAAIANVLQGAQVYKNLDIRVIKTVIINNEPITENLSVLHSPIRLVFTIPEEIRTPQTGCNREFFMVRAHEAEGTVSAETLPDLDGSDTTITVDSDKYSVYSIAYKDTKIEEEEQKNYTIRAESEGSGKVSPSGEVRVAEGKNQTFTFSPDAGFRVDQVLIDGNGVGAVPSYTFENIKADHTLKVIFGKEQSTAKERYEVTFDSQGGSAVQSIKNVEYGAQIQAPETPKRTGYTFTGWYTEKECKNQWDFAKNTITGNRTLYAGWKLEKADTVNGSGDTKSTKTAAVAKTDDATENMGIWWMAVSIVLMLAALLGLKKKRL